MSEETKKVQKTEREAKQEVQEVKPAELSDKDLDNVAGGSSNLNLSKANY